MARVSLSTVIVAHESVSELRRSLPALVAQLDEDDELIIVDNASTDDLDAEVLRLAPAARVLAQTGNRGFAAGANAGAAAARGDLLVLLNPDARVLPGWSDAIRAPWGGEFAAWMGLVLLKDGRRINTSGGVLHFTGFGWAGQVGEPVQDAPAAATEVGFVSGACLAIPRAAWQTAGGFSEPFFMYCEDVDLSLKLRLSGARLGVEPAARVEHAYEFAKGPHKWRMLERNRWATLLRTFPTPLLAAVAPALLAAEVAVWAIAVRSGWGRMKALATLDLVRWLPRLRRERRAIQDGSRVSSAEFAARLTAELSSPYFGAVGTQPLVRGAMRLYWRAVLAVIR
jgi:GT2 family glycosyltransferase